MGVTSAGALTPVDAAESPGLLELATWIVVAVLVLWLLVQLFHAKHVLV
jgi:hypothetical protein